MPVTPIHEPKTDSVMRVAGFISGSGSNLVKIIEHQQNLKQNGGSPYVVVCVFTDCGESNAKKIGERFNIPVIVSDIKEFYRERGHADKRDMSLRSEFDKNTIELIEGYNIDVIALAGYMSIVTQPLLERYAGRIINVHPADLRVQENGKRTYTGDRAVALAIKAGEPLLHSTVHIVREAVDYGEILMISAPVLVEDPGDLDLDDKSALMKFADEHQEVLKEEGDWVIFPKTLELLAQGKYGFDENGLLYFDGRAVPEGAIIDQVIEQ